MTQLPSLLDWARECERRHPVVPLSPTVQAAKRVRMMDGPFYWDSRGPFITTDIGSVTLATTNKALYPQSNFPVLGGNYFTYPGKGLLIRLFGRITTVATPGNGQWAVYYGTGVDANGTILASSTAQALQINQTNVSWTMETIVRCRTTGSTGTLFCTGWSLFNVAVVLSTAQPILIPASAPVVSGSVDLTATNIISVQFNRSGSTAETMQVHEMVVAALN